MIKEILDRLEPDEKRRLVHAFDNNFGQFVELKDGMFVGVNVKESSNFIVTEKVGVWSYGRINKNL